MNSLSFGTIHICLLRLMMFWYCFARHEVLSVRRIEIHLKYSMLAQFDNANRVQVFETVMDGPDDASPVRMHRE